MSRNKIIACNWKMNPVTKDDAKTLLNFYQNIIKSKVASQLIVLPPSVYLDFANEHYDLNLGVQDVSVELQGAFTSQISAKMAADMGCKYALVGHSETREYLGFSNKIIAEKFKTALDKNLTPVLCVGHSSDKNGTDINWKEISEQLEPCIAEYKNYSSKTQFIIAYEPVWAIGSGVIPTNEEILTVVSFIKKCLIEVLGQSDTEKIKILYGGSVNSKNIATLNQISELDGFLVGGASLIPEEIQKIVALS